MELKLETYVHPSLEIEVPIEIRKQVYEKAIEIIETPYLFGKNSPRNHLCIILPCIVFKLNDFLDDLPDGTYYDCSHTPKGFPELTKVRLLQIENDRTNEFRKQILQEMLNELNNK